MLKNTADAEDVVQDVFVYLLTKRIEFHDEEHERAWLVRSVICRSLNVLKRSAKKDVSLEGLSADPAARQVQDGEGDVLEAVMLLPPRYKSIIHLYYFEGYDQEEISCLLDLPLSTVKTRMVRGRRKLKKILEEEFGYEG